MRVAATADLHGMLPDLPECDLAIIAGDVCPVEGSHAPHDQTNWLKGHFRPWLKEQLGRCGNLVWIAGNHDFAAELVGFRHVVRDFPGTYLFENSVEIEGKKIYGIPWTPNLPNWAFYASDQGFEIQSEQIPTDSDIVVLHSPPIPVGGKSYPVDWNAPHIFTELNSRVEPELCVFGHVHEGRGQLKVKNTQYANVAYRDEFYAAYDLPIDVFEL